ncbi:hypothetical protein GF407_12235 [candidate division KSB1 bacterium]|nr:hypothetical protein [candidate division KSB1 bacterium]
MFRIVSLIVFVFLAIYTIWFVRNRTAKSWSVKNITSFFEECKYALTHLKSLSAVDFSKKLLLPLFWICMLLLGLSGFIPSVLFGVPMSGYLIILHVAIAPVFALIVTVMAVIWPYKYLFEDSELKRRKGKSRYVVLKKMLYWLLLGLTIPVISSILLSMFKYFGTDGQHLLLNIHRYSTLALVVVSVFYLTSDHLATKRQNHK